MKAYMFPGQASQYLGMGEGLFDMFAEETEQASWMLGYCIKTLCLEDPENRLDRTPFTQPAVYVVSVLDYMAKIQAGHQLPDYLLGHSVGEYAALFAAGAFRSKGDPSGFITGLKLIKSRAQLMGEISNGAMAAVMHPELRVITIIREVFEKYGLTNLDVANYNTPNQVVVSGPEIDIEDAKDYFEEAGANYYVLPVSGAFHSRYMEPAARSFASVLRDTQVSPLTIPVVSNLTGRPYKEGQVLSGLGKQLLNPVLWEESVRYLIEQGVDHFEEVGGGNILTNMVDVISTRATTIH